MSKMNKKLPALFLALVLVLGMTACGGKTEAPATTAAPAATEAAKEEGHGWHDRQYGQHCDRRRGRSQDAEQQG